MTENKTIYKCDFNKEAADDYYFDCRFESCDFSELILEKMVFENRSEERRVGKGCRL